MNIKKIIRYFLKNKVQGWAVLVLVIAVGYFGYRYFAGGVAVPRYVTAVAEKGTLILSVSGSGQVSALSQVDIKPKVTGDVTFVAVKAGADVKAGQLLFQIDASDAQKSVRDAETALETAKLELEELESPPDELELLKAENSLSDAKESKLTAESNIVEGYEDAFNAISSAFLDVPALVTGVRDVLYSEGIVDSEHLSPRTSNKEALTNLIAVIDYAKREEMNSFSDIAKKDYEDAKAKYDTNLADYKTTNRSSSQAAIEKLLSETIETARAVSDTIKSETNMLDFWVDYRSDKNLPTFAKVTSYQTDLKSYTSKVNSHITTLLSIERSLTDNKEAVLDAEETIRELEISLSNLKDGADELSLRAKRIAIQQKEDALTDAKEELSDHYVRAPFDGVVAAIDAKKGESVPTAAAATIITKQRMAEISLNEVDVAKVKTGQKVNITFDAVENLNITGEVAEVAAMGTVSQGVVNYNVKIAFDTQDERVKPGMSLSASVITDVKQDALLVPSAAVKSQGDVSYVEIMSADGTIARKTVDVGLSGDTSVEIVSGVNPGDKVVTQTITANTTSQTQTQSQGFGVPGMGTRVR